MDASYGNRKYIIGWLRCRPGRRDALMEIVKAYVLKCRAEEGCVFFDMNPSSLEPDMVTLAECFSNPEAHAAHLETEWCRAMFARFPEFCLGGDFENIYEARVEPDSVTFSSAP